MTTRVETESYLKVRLRSLEPQDPFREKANHLVNQACKILPESFHEKCDEIKELMETKEDRPAALATFIVLVIRKALLESDNEGLLDFEDQAMELLEQILPKSENPSLFVESFEKGLEEIELLEAIDSLFKDVRASMFHEANEVNSELQVHYLALKERVARMSENRDAILEKIALIEEAFRIEAEAQIPTADAAIALSERINAQTAELRKLAEEARNA